MKRAWLAPLVPLYAAGVALRSAGLRLEVEPVRKLRWPVISVGNISAGGTGKTPFAIALAKLLRREGFAVDVLSRGYGRSGTTVEQVDLDGSAERFGDEPLLIARDAGVPVFVGSERWRAGLLAEQSAGADGRIHLLDDGFQHRQLARLVDIVLVNSEDLDDWMLPAGNLREGAGALKRASVLAVSTEDNAAVDRLRRMGFEQPVWRFRREMMLPEVDGPVVAFCGIARPEQFFGGLERAGAAIAARCVFRDHHAFAAGDIARLQAMLRSSGAKALATTAKDRLRLGGFAPVLMETAPLHTIDLRIVLEDEADVAAFLCATLKVG